MSRLQRVRSLPTPSYNYRLQRSWGTVIFSQTSMILFTGGGLPQCMLGYHTPLAADPLLQPWQGRTPWQGSAPPLARQTTPTGKETPTCTVHAGRYGQQASGMHPTGMQFL